MHARLRAVHTREASGGQFMGTPLSSKDTVFYNR